MPLQATSGAASYDAFGGGVPVVPIYIEDVFSTYLYQADGSSTQTINNGINLSGKGGLVWIKSRSNATGNVFVDTVRGSPNVIQSNNANAQASWTNEFGSFSSTGFTVPYNTIYGETNFQTRTYVSWTFREQPKFFDVVTFTSAASGSTTFNHNLGSTPGCVFIKNTQTSDPWIVYHTGVGNNAYLQLNSTAAQDPLTSAFSATSTTFTINSSLMYTSQTYIAYLFASDAGGFGLTGTDNVISCGSFTTDAFKTGYATLPFSEAQWILVKCASNAGSWFIVDNMRGIYTNAADANGLSANTTAAETTRNIDYGLSSSNSQFRIFGGDGVANSDYIYIAIRRGPMKVPTVGTSVFAPALNTNSASGSSGSPNYLTNFPVDLAVRDYRPGGVGIASPAWQTRLTGTNYLVSSVTDSEYTSGWYFDSQTGFYYPTAGSNSDQNGWFFKRAPSYMDVVCYTGTGVARTVAHNLAAVPEMMIVKRRDAAGAWRVYVAPLGPTQFLGLDSSNAADTSSVVWDATTPTSSVFSVATNGNTNASGGTFVAYLFATCAGVSKCGSYTGTGTTLQIDCGFTGGARFVLIKRTDSTGGWYVWDSARGIVSGNDPYLLLNSTAAEVTNTDYIDTYSAGFEISSTAPAEINANGGSFIFLAIA